VGVCALKTTKLSFALLVALFTLVGCNSGDQSNTAQGVPSGNGTATLSWEAPTTTTTGSALTDLAGYRIYYGISASDLSQSIQLNTVGVQTYVIDNLGSGTWYFAIKAVTTVGVESALSDIVSKTISGTPPLT
jgi:uncharacterized lipoprotein NlpE involved in copper resistance